MVRRDLWRSPLSLAQGHLTGQPGSAEQLELSLLAQQLCRALLAHFTAGHTWLLLAQTDGGRWGTEGTA